jgi:hypothetical protein
VCNAKRESLSRAQPGGIDRGERRSADQIIDGLKQASHLSRRKHNRQRLRLPGIGDTLGQILAAERDAVENRNAETVWLSEAQAIAFSTR